MKRKHCRIIHISLSADLLNDLDQAATQHYSSRSEYIREAVSLRLKGEYVAKVKDEAAMFDEYLESLKSGPKNI